MATTQAAPSRVRTFGSTSPATGEVVGSFPLDGSAQVAAAVARARQAAVGCFLADTFADAVPTSRCSRW